MVKKIIQIADIHIPNIENDNEYNKLIDNLIISLSNELNGLQKEEIRIAIVGDIFDFKNKTSPEANTIFYKLLNYLDSIAKTIIIAGNHDMLEQNKNRKDAISPIFEAKNSYNNIFYADKILNYKSGYIVDDNLIWVLFSIFDKYKEQDIEKIKNENKNKTVVGLFHGEVVGAKNFNGTIFDKGLDSSIFNGCDIVLAGHIHKRQELKKNGIKILYSGSLKQKDEGETITCHGYNIIDVCDLTYKSIDVENEYNIIKFKIESYDDIYDDKERIVNL